MSEFPQRIPAEDTNFIPQMSRDEAAALIPGKPSDRNIESMRGSSGFAERGDKDEHAGREIIARVGSFPVSPGPLSGQAILEIKKADDALLRQGPAGANVMPPADIQQRSERWVDEKNEYDSERGALATSHLPRAAGLKDAEVRIVGRDVQDSYYRATRPNDPSTEAFDGSDPMGVGDEPDVPEQRGNVENNSVTDDISSPKLFPEDELPNEDQITSDSLRGQ